MPDTETNPKLRLEDAQPFDYEGSTYILLRDPLELVDKNILVPQPLVPALTLCDGTRNIAALRGAMALRYGMFISPDRIQSFIDTLDEAYLLDNDRSRKARRQAQARFRKAPFRKPANAGLSYPDNPVELANLLQGYIDALDGSVQPVNGVRGIVSPHIDYERGGPVYAQVWAPAADAVRKADLAIIFGTDHFSEGFSFSLTRQTYATPFGLLPTALDIVDQVPRCVLTQFGVRGRTSAAALIHHHDPVARRIEEAAHFRR